MPGNEKLVHAALLLRGQAPEAWDLFVQAMREYAASSAEEMVRCAPELLMRAQGMAIASSEICYAVRFAPQIHEKNQGFKHGRPTQQWSSAGA